MLSKQPPNPQKKISIQGDAPIGKMDGRQPRCLLSLGNARAAVRAAEGEFQQVFSSPSSSSELIILC